MMARVNFCEATAGSMASSDSHTCFHHHLGRCPIDILLEAYGPQVSADEKLGKAFYVLPAHDIVITVSKRKH